MTATSLLVRAFTVLRGLVYSAFFVWLWAWVAVTVRRYDPRIPVTLPPWLRPVGYGVAFAGALIAAACIGTFVTRGRGTPAPFDPPRTFVATGPYRWVRNPMYIGAAAVILGFGLVLSSPSIVLLSFAFLVVMHLFVVILEEPALESRFGDAYGQYRSSVSRWLIHKPAPARSAS
jgi:protein-S-isoprenylcysteine O-methyltransferase Ste14